MDLRMAHTSRGVLMEPCCSTSQHPHLHTPPRLAAHSSRLSRRGAFSRQQDGWIAGHHTPRVGVLVRSSLPEQQAISGKPSREALAPVEDSSSSSSVQGEGVQASPEVDLTPSYLQLVCVSVLWGLYGPSVSWLLHTEHAMPPSMLTALRTAMSGVVILSIAYYSRQKEQEQLSISAASGREVAAEVQSSEESSEVGTSDRAEVPLLARTLPGVVPAGIELGLWNFIGTALTITGLEFTSPTRAGFLIQLTAVGTPMMAALAGQFIPKRTILAAIAALGGSILIGLDDSPAPFADAASQGAALNGHLGDVLFVSACLFFSLATMRLSLHAPQHSPIQLAASKKVTLGVLSLAWLAVTPQDTDTALSWGQALGQQTPFEWLVITVSALGPGALAAFLQTSGQAKVPSTMAQVIYSLTPLWSALAAWAFLEDHLGPLAWTGGAIVLAASLFATTGGREAQEPAQV